MRVWYSLSIVAAISSRSQLIKYFSLSTADIDECTESPSCQNGGTCTNTYGSFTCDCSGSGFEGPFCGGESEKERPVSSTKF